MTNIILESSRRKMHHSNKSALDGSTREDHRVLQHKSGLSYEDIEGV